MPVSPKSDDITSANDFFNNIVTRNPEFKGLKVATLDPKYFAGGDGIHPSMEGYKSVLKGLIGSPPAQPPAGGAAGVQTVSAPGSVPPPITTAAYVPGQTPNPFIGIPSPEATGANPHLVPPKSEWPEGASGVQHNSDGSLGYIMDDGRVVPVPGSTASHAYGSPAPTATGTGLDFLRPKNSAELGLRITNEINEIERQNAAAEKHNSESDILGIKGKISDLVQGRQIGPKEFAADQEKYASSKDQKVKDLSTEYGLVRENLIDLQSKSPQDVQAKIDAQEGALAEMREKAPNDPRVDQMESVLKSTKIFLTKYEQDIKTRPLMRASESGIVPPGAVQPLDPADPNLDKSIQNRQAAISTTRKAFGTDVPFFLEGEGAQFARGLARNPDALSKVTDPAVINRMADDSGFRTAVDGLTRSGDPTTMNGAFKTLDVIAKTNPIDFDNRFKDMRARLDLWNNLLVNMDPKLATARLMAMDEPGFETTKKYREEAADKALKDVRDTDVVKMFATSSLFNPLSWGGNPAAPTADVDTPMASAGAMRSDFVKAYREYFIMDPNPTNAQTYATNSISRQWGVSTVAGNVVMKTPPEHYYKGIGDGESRGYLKADLDAAIRKHSKFDENIPDHEYNENGIDVSTSFMTPAQKEARNEYEAPRTLVADSQTAKELASGQLPTYHVVLLDKRGNLDVLRGDDGRPMRWPSEDFRKRADNIGKDGVADADRLPEDIAADKDFVEKQQSAISSAQQGKAEFDNRMRTLNNNLARPGGLNDSGVQ